MDEYETESYEQYPYDTRTAVPPLPSLPSAVQEDQTFEFFLLEEASAPSKSAYVTTTDAPSGHIVHSKTPGPTPQVNPQYCPEYHANMSTSDGNRQGEYPLLPRIAPAQQALAPGTSDNHISTPDGTPAQDVEHQQQPILPTPQPAKQQSRKRKRSAPKELTYHRDYYPRTSRACDQCSEHKRKVTLIHLISAF